MNASTSIYAPSNQLGRRGYLGFEVSAEADPKSTQIPPGERWLVSEIDEGSPAQKATLRFGDEVVSLANEAITSLAQLRSVAGRLRPGETSQLKVLRNAQELNLPLCVGTMPVEPLTNGRVLLDSVPWQSSEQTFLLRAIWTLPPGPGPFPAIWFLPSIAWISQENPLSTWDPTYQLIDALTSSGFATLRVDRSGLGDSEGPHCSQLDFTAEMSAWYAAREHFLRSPLVKEGGHLLYGRSFGGILAPLLAAHHPFAGVAVWGTLSERWHEGSLNSTAYQLALRGASESEVERVMSQTQALQELVYLHQLTPAQARARRPDLNHVQPEAFCDQMVHDRVAVFFHQLESQDVAAAWRAVKCPVLAVHAEYDVLTRSADLRKVAELVGPSGQFVELPGVDHFMHARSSLEEAVKVPWGGEFSPSALTTLCDFFRQITPA